MSSYYSFKGKNSQFIYFSVWTVEERPLLLYNYFSIYVIVILSDDGRHKRLKSAVEDKWMFSV